MLKQLEQKNDTAFSVANASLEQSVGWDAATCFSNDALGQKCPAIIVRSKFPKDICRNSPAMILEWRETAETMIQHLAEAGYPGYVIEFLYGNGFTLNV